MQGGRHGAKKEGSCIPHARSVELLGLTVELPLISIACRNRVMPRLLFESHLPSMQEGTRFVWQAPYAQFEPFGVVGALLELAHRRGFMTRSRSL